MQSFEFQVVILCPLEMVFAIYVDTDRWCNRSIFGEIRWTQGNAWEQGSRLRVETTTPIRSVVDQVVLEFERNRSVSYISHVYGITCHTRVSFAAIAGGTSVGVSMELVGMVSRALGFAIEPAIEKTTRRFFLELRRECEEAEGGATSQN